MALFMQVYTHNRGKPCGPSLPLLEVLIIKECVCLLLVIGDCLLYILLDTARGIGSNFLKGVLEVGRWHLPATTSVSILVLYFF